MADPSVADRTRRAGVTAAFGYLQLGLSLVAGLVVFPVTVRVLGAREYGLWLASGEVLGYLLLLDTGVFSVLPWLFAAAHGRGDDAAIRGHLACGLAIGGVMGVLLAGLAAAVWWVPGLLPLPPDDAESLRGPLALLLVLTAAAYPLKAFATLTAGLQDATFTGGVAVLQAALTAGLSLGAVLAGFGLWGLAAAAGGSVLLAHAISVPRAASIAGHLLRGPIRPSWTGVRTLLVEGGGGWLGAAGYRLLAASGAVILVATDHPEWVTMYAATAKAGQILQQGCWVLPDSALMGLAQLHGGGDRAGASRVALCTLHLHALGSGVAAVGLLAFNPAFVRLLMGPDLFAGVAVNALLAAGLFVGSAAHGALKATAVVGHRPLVGVLTVAWGAAHCGGVILLLAYRGLPGLAEAALFVALTAGLLPALWAVKLVHGIPERDVLVGVLGRWVVRAAPTLALAGWAGWAFADGPYPVLATFGGAILVAHVWSVRGLVVSVPWPERVHGWLIRLRVMPSAPPIRPPVGA